MAVPPHAVGVDLGTSVLKVGLFDAHGHRAASTSRAIATKRGAEASAEQDAEVIWLALVESIRQIVRDADLAPEAIVAIGCTAQYASLVAVDAAARPLSPLLTWMDRRGAEHSRAILERHPEAVDTWRRVHGLQPLPHGGDSLSHALHLQHDCAALWGTTTAVLEPVDYLTARLTGRVAANECSMFMSLLVDHRSRGVTAYDPTLLALSGLDAAKLPPLVPVGDPLGGLSSEAAEALGLAPSVQVLPGLNDTQALALATGSLSGARGGICIGTTSVLVTHVESKTADLERGILTMPGPLDAEYVVMAENGIGGKALEHFLRRQVHVNDALGEHGSSRPYAGLEMALSLTSPGSGGLLFLPWLDGSLAPRPRARMRGGFFNMSLSTTREEMARAVLEGVAHNLRWLTEEVERFAGDHLDALTFTGGGAQSAGWAQILADVFGRPILRAADPRRANSRAVAVLALYRLGQASLEAAEAASGEALVPRAEHRARYDAMHEAFIEAFEHTAPILDRLNRE